MRYFNFDAFNKWRKRGKGKVKVVAGKSIAPLFKPTERCEDCQFFYDKLWCLKKRKSGEGCKVPLLFTTVCPTCGRTRQGKRQWGETKIYFKCAGVMRSGHPCQCLYSLSFHGASDSPEEISKREWLRGENQEWTDFSIRRIQ